MNSPTVSPPGPSPLPWLRWTLPRDPLNGMLNLSRAYGDIVGLSLGPQPVYLLNHPNFVQAILNTGPQAIYPVSLPGLEPEICLHADLALAPFWQPVRQAESAALIATTCQETAAAWPAKTRLDLSQLMAQLALSIAFRLLAPAQPMPAGLLLVIQAVMHSATPYLPGFDQRRWFLWPIRPSLPHTWANYTLTFRARADHPLSISAWVQQDHDPWQNWLDFNSFDLTTDWQKFSLTVAATGSDEQAQLIFGLGAETGTFWLDDVHLQAAAPDVYRRDFDNGIVLVNATTQTVSVPLDDEFHKIDGTQDRTVNDGSTVSEVSLPPLDGIILLRP